MMKDMFMPKATVRKFLVIPFRREGKKGLVMGEMRHPSSAAAAERTAMAMSSRYAGVLAYDVAINNESGEMSDPRLLYRAGETIDVMQEP